MLKDYLRALRSQEKTATLEGRPAWLLAKLAGLKLAENQCPECGSGMSKEGSLYKCACGMMKKALDLQLEGPSTSERYVAPFATALGATGGALGGAHLGSRIAPGSPRGQLAGHLAGGLLGGMGGGFAGLGAGGLAKREMGLQRVTDNRQKVKDAIMQLRANQAIQMARQRIPPHLRKEGNVDPMLAGAAIGGIGGAGLGALTAEKDKRGRGALIGGGVGAGFGAGLGALSKGKYTETDRAGLLMDHAKKMEAKGVMVDGLKELLNETHGQLQRQEALNQILQKARGA